MVMTMENHSIPVQDKHTMWFALQEAPEPLLMLVWHTIIARENILSTAKHP